MRQTSVWESKHRTADVNGHFSVLRQHLHSHDLPHDFAGQGMLNVLVGVPVK